MTNIKKEIYTTKFTEILQKHELNTFTITLHQCPNNETKDNSEYTSYNREWLQKNRNITYNLNISIIDISVHITSTSLSSDESSSEESSFEGFPLAGAALVAATFVFAG